MSRSRVGKGEGAVVNGDAVKIAESATAADIITITALEASKLTWDCRWDALREELMQLPVHSGEVERTERVKGSDVGIGGGVR